MNCYSRVWYYYERDTNYKACLHEDYDEAKPDNCPGEYAADDAKADVRYGYRDKY